MINKNLATDKGLNNFQREETARWLLNISQAVAVGGAGSLLVPGIGERVGILGTIASTIFALILYLLAMYIGRKVKND